MLTIALSHLLGRGVRLETHEAVALARELLAHPCGIPTPENIQLGSDGSASCISTDGMPSVASVADLLLTLLPSGTPNVPAPLRYAIARGLEAVEAPPFASLGEFSSALERFEKGASRDVLRGVLQRGARPSRPIAAPIAVAPAPVTPPAAGRSPVAPRPTVVPPRSTLVVRKPAASSSEPPSQSLPRRRCSGPSAPTEKRARLCTHRGGGHWRPRRHSSRRLRWASPSRTESPTGVPRQSHPAPRACRPGSRPPHLLRTIRLRTRRK